MPMYKYKRDDAMLEKQLLLLSIDVPLTSIHGWTSFACEAVDRWCVAMAASNPSDGLCITPVPSALTGYVMAYGPTDRHRQDQA